MGLNRQRIRDSLFARLDEASCNHTWAMTDFRNGNSIDRPEDDFVAKYQEWREKCPDFSNASHAAFCERCDNSYPSFTGGAEWANKHDGRGINPYEPLNRSNLKESKKFMAKYDNFAKTRKSNLLATDINGRKIEEPGTKELSAQEDFKMTESTNEYIRSLLRMSGGDALGGREGYTVPDELMDALAGDAAQEEMLKSRVLEEMRKQVVPEESEGSYVNLDMLTESMEKGDVDGFLDKARKKIIKRSKATRRACCKKIGGVLKQMVGPAGGEHAKQVDASDRGKSDPIGEDILDENLSDEHKKVYAFRKGESRGQRAARIARYKKFGSVDEGYADPPAVSSNSKFSSADERVERPLSNKGGRLPKQQAPKKGLLGKASDWLKKKLGSDVDHDFMNFIAEEFEISEHSDDCPLRAVLSETDSEVHGSETAGAVANFMETVASAKPYWEGASEADYNKGYDTSVSPVKSGKSKKAGDPGKASARGVKPGDPIGSDVDVDGPQISETAQALVGFMESAISAKPYYGDAVEAPYNKGYDTECSPVKSGKSKMAGKPGKPSVGKHRYDKGADPIGEDTPDEGVQISETAQALAGFMESAACATPYWEGAKTRKDERKTLGEPIKKAKGYGVRKGSKGVPGDPIGDAS